ncbi:MAG: diguanylate cyclase [Clostridia bacterium]
MLITENKRPTILLVDDTPSNLMVLGEFLQDKYEVIVATDGQTALKKIAFSPPDIILLDILMSDMDGYEVCRRIKGDPGAAHIPIIFITAKNAEEDEAQGLDAGAVDYITKPFSLPIVGARIRTHLELKKKTDLLESLSQRDGLTGIFNRRQFNMVMEAEWKRATREGRPITVIMLDIDNFKLFNDNYGHLSGDECLKTIARALSNAFVRSTDFVARYGGEEFVIILPDTHEEKARDAGERARNTVESLHIVHGFSHASPYVTISVGVASTIPKPQGSFIDLLEKADSAMYEAKLAGRNQVKTKAL